MTRLAGVQRFARTVAEIGSNLPPGDDQDAARWVASGIFGIYQGIRDAGHPLAAESLLFTAADLVAQLASGKWREDVLRERIAAAPREVQT